MKVLDLFSGIGGFSLGLERAGFETVAFCEIEEYPREVLKKHWPNVPIYNDVKELTYERLKQDGIAVDVICGGFPCQDISVAGKQAGINQETRSGLWSEFARLLGEIRPRYAICENVTALLNGCGGNWFKRVLWDISQVGYDAEWHCIPASELGAHHHRDRIWIIAYPNELANRKQYQHEAQRHDSEGESFNVADPKRQRQQGQGLHGRRIDKKALENWKASRAIDRSQGNTPIWDVEPTVGRVANGIPNRSHRLKCLGNAVVPQIPELIGRALKK